MSITIESLNKIEKAGNEICDIVTANELTYDELFVLLELLRKSVIESLEQEKNEEEEENEAVSENCKV